jgi:hypothetical protein
MVVYIRDMVARRGEICKAGKTALPGEGERRETVTLYFTAPVMPSANCFCRMKKMMTVGREQNRTLILPAL